MTKDSSANVQVFMRMRPFGEKERDKDKGYSFEIDDNIISENESLTSGKLKFEYDHVFGPEARNKDVYDRVARGVVDSCLTGYNGVVFAYGQTSSGKTHSVVGYDGDEGLIPMAMHHVFDHIKSSRREWLLRISYIEVYNEQLHDLLNPSTPPTKLVIYEDDMGHTQVKNLQEEIVRSEQDVMDFLARGAHNRHVSATAMNAQSSRSHAVFTMIIESKEIGEVNSFRFAGGNRKSLKEKGSAVTVSCLYMVDLAGSERGDKTLAVGKTLGEGSFINKSLLNLSKCITQLAKSGGKKTFISYRDSKLTRLIRVGLGGNSKLSVLCCITPGYSHYQESISTMRFGQSARMIQNKSTVNQVKDETALLKQYKREIEELRQKLMRNSSIGNNEELVQELERHKEERQELENALKEITQLILVGNVDAVDTDHIEESEFVSEDTTDREDNIPTQQGVLLDVDSDPSTFSDNEADIDTSDCIHSPKGSPKAQTSFLSTSFPSLGHHRSCSLSSIPSFALTPANGESSILSKLKSRKNVAADLKQQIKFLRETIEELKKDKANFDTQRQQWEEERKSYEVQKHEWETEKASLKSEQRFIKNRDQVLNDQRNMREQLDEEKSECVENKISSQHKGLETLKSQIRHQLLASASCDNCHRNVSSSTFVETTELNKEVQLLRRTIELNTNHMDQTCAQLKEELAEVKKREKHLEEQNLKNQEDIGRVTQLLEEIRSQVAQQHSSIHFGFGRWLFYAIRSFFLLNAERTVWILLIIQVLIILL